ncbi:MAG: roadblock/LC7 domain-containing protein [Candidatus Mcinerneyibacterium aminivorans]|uniref:Roadblock/LC7 domain-containing protein n=1 Tax=Candidatus Mcinerneyibacterium aminivorans TaxID=2703815 RepID=A0A5D0MGI0_9BACT|nr:MAG: roadblock/LC7 domain-containing protein [Candidatus Mcinerneyibacterium aminivorans]
MKMNGEVKQKINDALSHLIWETSSKCVFLVDINGNLISAAGYTGDIDTVDLASLSASHFAATAALARMMNDNKFTVLFHKGKKESIDINKVGSKYLLVTVFGEKTVLGVLQKETKKTIDSLESILKEYSKVEEKPIKDVKNTLSQEIDSLLKDM